MKKWLLILGCIILSGQISRAQSCTSFDAKGDTVLACNTGCFTLKALIPDIRSSERYEVLATPYNPYAYVTAAPQLTLPCPTNDDKFYQVSSMPFDFCFYGVSCRKFVVSTNGILSFDTLLALKCNGYDLTPTTNRGLPLPASGTGTCGGSNLDCATPNGVRFPKACIMGAYYDLDIDRLSANKKVEYRVEGTAPCRRLVVSFNEVPLYGSGSTCTGLYATQQIVLYEGTGIIDVYIKDKPVCSWNEDHAIIGIQNWDFTDAAAPPDRNNTSGWGGFNINEGWRFIPSGPVSRFKRVELYLGATLVATGTTAELGNGSLEASFANICPTQPISNYRVVAYYTTCTDANAETAAEGTIRVTKGTQIPIATVILPGSCSNSGVGSITVNPVGAGYEYSIDGLPWQLANVFAGPVGPHTVRVRNVASGCLDSVLAVVPLTTPFTMSLTTTATKCYGSADGRVTISTNGGSTPFQYSADGGQTYQNNHLFNLSAGSYIIRVKDANNCTKDSAIDIVQPDSMRISHTVAPAFCSGTADGKITVVTSGGTPGYTYSLGGSTYQTSNVLASNVGTGTVFVKDTNNCIQHVDGIVVVLSDTMRLAPIPDTTLCQGSGLLLQPNTNATQFVWSPATGLNATTVANPTASPTDTITYYVSASLGTLCARSDTFTIAVLKPPIPNAGVDTTICYDTQAQLFATAIRGNGYRWTPATGLNNPTIANPLMTLKATTTFTVAVTDPYNCGFIRTDAVTVTVRPKVRADAGQDTTATLGTPVQLFGCCMNLYQWLPAYLFVNDTARNPIGNFPVGTHQVVMLTTTPEGCNGKDTVIVKSYQGPDYYVPTGFSPGNRDGINDVFRPVPVGIEETFFFSVFNRYGQLLFTTKTFFEGWDGTYKGQLQPEGAYVWMVKGRGLGGKIIEKKGTVVLIRN